MAHASFLLPSERAAGARAWPFEEARKLVERFKDAPPAKGYVLFETGYGPSGLPHLGTFGEVVRTTYVMQAFRRLSDLPVRLFCFSDDMDGLRKVPDNVPNQSTLKAALGLPLTKVPDPFGTHDSFGAHNNARLRAFLDGFGFSYEFQSSTDYYRSGRFDRALLAVMRHWDEVMEVMLPTLGEERQQSYAPFLPISPSTGRVLQVPILERDAERGLIVFEDEDGTRVTQPVTGGHAKLQWKPDWAMRWFALDVDYEMAGKDLIPSVELAGKIVKILGGRPPEGFNYELFLDEKGQKISKSKGNGLSIEEWLTYGPPESLKLFMYQQPRRAKRLYFDVIPRTVDDYLQFVEKFTAETPDQQLENPAWHLHDGAPPVAALPLSFSMLLNLASVANAEQAEVLWGFIRRYAPGTTPESAPLLARLVEHALAYYRDFVKPAKSFRPPSEVERAALEDLVASLEQAGSADSEALQTLVYDIGKRHPFAGLRDWFKAFYEVVLGQSEGPRLGSFIALYGTSETAALTRQALAGGFLKPAG